jgi:hypothetical protein
MGEKGRSQRSRRAPLYGWLEWEILRHDAASSAAHERAARGRQVKLPDDKWCTLRAWLMTVKEE